MKNRSLLPYLVLLLAFTFILNSCRSKKDNSITVAFFNAPASQSLIKLIPEFEKETGIKVNYEILPYADLKSKVEQQFMTQNSTYDVIMSDCIWIPTFAERHYLSKLDTSAYKPGTYDFKDILPALTDYLGKYPKDGIRYGMPFMSNTHMMVYRLEIVEPIAKSLGYSLPGEDLVSAWTWEMYLNVAKKISEKYSNSTKKIYGTSLQARAGAWIIYEWYSELFGFINDEKARISGLPSFDENAAKAMQYYANLYKSAPPEALTWGHEEETAAICSGLCAMDATSNVELAANLYKNECASSGTLKFCLPPKGISGNISPDMGGYGLLVSAFSKNISEASAFILWAADKDTHKKIVLGGGSPIRESEISDKEILAKYPYLSFYDKLIANSVYRARIPKWGELEDIISRELTSVMKNEKSSNDAATAVQNWVTNNVK
jgi:multiple sugar transport system substrate-binding protein